MNLNRPQPHEGIEPIERFGDPVLENPAVSAMLGNLAYRLKRAYLFGGTQYDQYQAMLRPVLGDLVMVTDAFPHKDQDTKHQAVGYLLAHREEWWTIDAQWEEQRENDPSLSDDERAIEPDAYYIQYGPTHVCRWVNCEVIKIQ